MEIFDPEWLATAKENSPKGSWVEAVFASLPTSGGMYLSTLRLWFERFPAPSVAERKLLKARLESHTKSDHLGAVNELAWWEFMRQAGIVAEPLKTAATPRPDFRVSKPCEVFVEVSTLNLSDAERKGIEDGSGVELNHTETMRRLCLKIASEKEPQIAYAATKDRPCALVVFDYTTWSTFGTDIVHVLAESLLGERPMFAQLPRALSALVYVERHVLDGTVALSKNGSAVYYNPVAANRMEKGIFSSIRQFACELREVEPQCRDPWIWL